MERKEIQAVYSHLVLFNKPKVAMVRGFIEQVFGMLLSETTDEKGEISTNRTILCGEELNPMWHLSDEEVYGAVPNGMVFFKEWPKITMKDLSNIINACNDDALDLYRRFDCLKNLGCVFPEMPTPLIVKVSAAVDFFDEYAFKEIRIDAGTKWKPLALGYLYSIQSLMGIRVVLENDNDNGVDSELLNMMNELLANQYSNGIYASDGQYNAMNDGVYTYIKNNNNERTKMDRETFLKLYPKSYEYLG